MLMEKERSVLLQNVRVIITPEKEIHITFF